MQRFSLRVGLSCVGLIAALSAASFAQVAQRGSGQLVGSRAQKSSSGPYEIRTRPDALDPDQFSKVGTQVRPNYFGSVRSTGLDLSVAAREGSRSIPQSSLALLGPSCPCPAGSNMEGETCGDSTNEGCSFGFCGVGGFIDVASGDTWCGNAWADGGTRDLDYYRIDLPTISTLSVTTTSQFPANTFVAEDPAGDCSTLLVLDVVSTDTCIPGTMTITLRAGTYYVGIGAGDANGSIFDGIPCAGGSNEYFIDFAVSSADCLGACSGVTEAEACGADTNGGCDAVSGVPSVEILAVGTTVCGTVTTDTGGDLDWYEFTIGTTSEVTVTVNSEVSTLFGLTSADCVDPGTGVFAPEFTYAAGVDGGCGGGTAVAVLGAGTYYAFIGAGDAFGFFIDGVPCADPANGYQLTITTGAPTPPCAVGTAATSFEAEACGDAINEGCNAGGLFTDFELIDPETAPVSRAGSAFASGGLRDTDWYVMTLTQDWEMTLSLDSQSPMTAILLPFDCANLFIVAQTSSDMCAPNSSVLNVASGEYIVLVLPAIDAFTGIFEGAPCGYANDYVMGVELAPIGSSGCTITVPGGAIAEAESCGQALNDGCVGATFAGEALGVDPNVTVSGTLIADGTRDFDVFEFTLSAATEVNFQLTSNLPVSASIATEACALGGWFVDCDDMDLVTNPGDCSVTTGVSQVLPPGDYELIVTVGGAVFGICPNPAFPAVFSGFPCGTSNDYALTISTGGAPGCFFPTGTVTPDCVNGNIDLDLVASSCYNDLFYEITDAGGTIVASGTINGPIAAGDVIMESVPVSGSGTFQVAITANCCNGDSDQGFAAAGLYPYSGQTDIVIDADFDDGCIDSAGALAAALVANGRSVLVVDLFAFDLSTWECGGSLDSSNNIWVCQGTFPNDLPLLQAEGQALVDFMTLQGVDIYQEGADVWGFHAATPFFDFDGVAGRLTDGNLMADGDDTFTQMIGVSGTNIDTSAFGVVDYGQDSRSPILGDDDFTDQLLPSGDLIALEDEPAGSTSEIIWNNNDDGIPFGAGEPVYGTGTAYVPSDAGFGRVVAQSWEFGGFAGNQNMLASTYLDFFAGGMMGGDEFKRGDANSDSGFDISDAIFTLAALFTPGSPLPSCRDAGDANDDGGYDISDAIYTLAALFTPGSPLPPAPGPATCGVDPTMDSLDCAVYAPCGTP